MRVIVAGGRDVTNPLAVESAIEDFQRRGFEITLILSGGCRGADALGEQWAESHGIPIRRFPAEWSLYGRAAGPIRNAKMAENADALIAIWDGESRGTENMIETAKARGLVVHIHPVY